MSPADRPPKTYSELETVSDEGDAPSAIGVVLDPSDTGDPRPSADVARIRRRLDTVDANYSQLRTEVGLHWALIVGGSIAFGIMLAVQVLQAAAIAWVWAGSP